jgi:hypothetical protein
MEGLGSPDGSLAKAERDRWLTSVAGRKNTLRGIRSWRPLSSTGQGGRRSEQLVAMKLAVVLALLVDAI